MKKLFLKNDIEVHHMSVLIMWWIDSLSQVLIQTFFIQFDKMNDWNDFLTLQSHHHFVGEEMPYDHCVNWRLYANRFLLGHQGLTMIHDGHGDTTPSPVQDFILKGNPNGIT